MLAVLEVILDGEEDLSSSGRPGAIVRVGHCPWPTGCWLLVVEENVLRRVLGAVVK